MTIGTQTAIKSKRLSQLVEDAPVFGQSGGKSRLDSLIDAAPVFDEKAVLNRTRDVMDEFEEILKQPQTRPVLEKLGALREQIEGNIAFKDFASQVDEANRKHSGAIELISRADREPSLKARLGLFPSVQEYQRDVEGLESIRESPEIQKALEAQGAYRTLFEQNADILNRFLELQTKLSQTDPATIEQAAQLLRFDVKMAKDYLAKVTQPEYQQNRSAELKGVRDKLYAKYQENLESNPQAAKAFLRETTKIDEEIHRDFYDTREKTEIARKVAQGDTAFLTDQPSGSIREVISRGIEGLLSMTPISGETTVSELDMRRRVEGFQQTDPDFAQIIRGSIAQREPGIAEQIAGGAAHILAVLPSYRISGQIASKAFPKLAKIPLARTSPGGTRVVLQGSEAARAATVNILTMLPRGGLKFGTQAQLTGGEEGPAAITGAAFETTETIAAIVEQTLPTKLRYARYIAPITRAFLSGTSFAAGSAGGSALLGEGDVNIYEEFGKGALLSLFHTAAEKVERRINEKEPNLRTPDDEVILERAKQLKAAKDIDQVKEVLGGEPVAPKPPVNKTVIQEPGLGKGKREDIRSTIEKLKGTSTEEVVDAGQRKEVQEGDELTKVVEKTPEVKTPIVKKVPVPEDGSARAKENEEMIQEAVSKVEASGEISMTELRKHLAEKYPNAGEVRIAKVTALISDIEPAKGAKGLVRSEWRGEPIQAGAEIRGEEFLVSKKTGKAPKSRLEQVVDEAPLVAKAEEKQLSSTQVNIPAAEAKPFVDFAGTIPEAEIYDTPEKEFGREKEPHVTALFGLKDATPEQIKDIVRDFGDVKLTLGKTSVFKNPEYDVLKVDVKSDDLVKLNKMLREKAEYESDFPDYQPHLTIAYLKPGMGKKYAGYGLFEGKTFTVSELMFSDPDFQKTAIDLKPGRKIGQDPKWLEMQERLAKGEDIKDITADMKQRGLFETPGEEGEWRVNDRIEVYNYVTQEWDESYVARLQDGKPAAIKTSIEGVHSTIGEKQFRKPETITPGSETIPTGKETAGPESETIDLQKHFRDGIVKKLGGPDVLTPKGTIGRLSDKDLLDEARRAGIKEVVQDAPQDEAPVSQGGDINVRGEANQKQIEKFVKEGKLPLSALARPLSESTQELAKQFGGISPKSIEAYQAAFEEAMSGDASKLVAVLHTGNTNLRKLFTKQTGITLPKTESGTRSAIEDWSTPKAKASETGLKQLSESRPIEIKREGLINEITSRLMAKEGTWQLVRNNSKDNVMLVLTKEVQDEAIDISTSLDDIDLIRVASDDQVLLDGIAEKVYNSIAEEIRDEQESATDDIERPASGGSEGALEGTQPEDVSGTPSERRARKRTPRGDSPDAPGGDRAEDVTRREGPRSNVGGSIGVGTAQGAVVVSPGRNYRITPEDYIGEGTVTQKFAANLAAIELLKKLESQGRMATPEEMRVLVKYVGWGGIPQAFDQYNDKWSAKHTRLRDALTEDEYESARGSTLNAHYTSTQVIEAMYRLIDRLGFKGGRILEPSMGIGHFLGLLPAEMAQRSKLVGIELDSLTGRIAKQLYQDADVRIQGYEETPLPDGYFDLIVSNFPFGNYGINDPDPRLRGMTASIHNYFFGKSLLKVRPGGLVIAITSRFTMDAGNPTVRKWISDQADLLGAIRLPSSAFEGNAGTAVTTDIIVLQKREGPAEQKPAWLESSKLKGPNGQEYNLNEYYQVNPNMMLGKISFDRGLYSGNEFSIKKDDRDLTQAVNKAIETFPANVFRGKGGTASVQEPKAAAELIPAEGDVKQGAFTLKGERLYQRVENEMQEVQVSEKELDRIKGLIGIRDSVRKVLRTQLEDKPEAEIKKTQTELNTKYDTFRKKFGLIVQQKNTAYRDDPDFQLLRSLEKIEEGKVDQDKVTVRKADIFTKRVLHPTKRIDKAQSGHDALSIVLEERGVIDFDRMQELTGKSKDELITDLAGVIFRTPQNDWVTADEYLSGDVKKRLKDAQAAAEIDQSFRANVEALKDVLPEDLKPNEIEARLGSSWIPPEDISDFISQVLSLHQVEIKYIPALAQWNLLGAKRYQSETANIKKWGIPRYPALDLIRDALNGQFPIVFDIEREADGKQKRVVNPQETAAAAEKMQTLKDEFKRWIWADTDRMKRLADYYNENFNNFVARKYDGSHLRFEGMNEEWRGKLRDYQKNAAWRQIVGGNTLLAHVVGAGKTFEMIMAAMEMRRLGTRKKPMFVVPNHMLEQWKDDIYKLYPGANILMATKRDFEQKRRSLLMSKIATGDWDAVLVTHRGYENITMGAEYYKKFINEQILELEQAMEEERAEGGKGVKDLEKKKKQFITKLEKVIGMQGKDVAVTFDELGVDQLFIDEAHFFKNLFVVSRMRNIAGLSFSESNRAMDMFLKTKYISDFNNGKGGIVFATGTPVTNSLAELYTMQRYLQMATLRENNLDKFDTWAANFGEIQSVVELTVEGKGYRARNRFSRLVNFAELMNRFLQVADIKTAEMIQLPDIPAIKGGKARVVMAPSTPEMKAFLEELAERAEKVRARKIAPTIDNMLKISTDGRKAAIDMRLINPEAGDRPDNKLTLAAGEIHRIWKETEKDKLAQIVFIDYSTPTRITFNAYDDLKSKLIKKGVPANEIAFIHDTENTANVDEAKKRLFQKVNNGTVRILIGSTNKLGVGTNVQRLLVAEHDIDAPWRPADVEQRSGRILRSGNQNKEVEIIRYVTETSFDAYMWQILEAKIRAIQPIFSGNSKARIVEDVEARALTAAEVKAIASGNPIVMEKVNVDMEVARLEALESSFSSNMYDTKMRLAAIPERVQEYKRQVEGSKKDKAVLEQYPTKGDAFEITIGGKKFTERKAAGAELIRLAIDIKKKDQHFKDIPVGTFRGLEIGLNVGFAEASLRIYGSEKKYSANISEDALGTIRSLEHAADPETMSDYIRTFENEVVKQERMKKELEEETTRPFEQSEKLGRYRNRQLELQKALDLDKYTEEPEETRTRDEDDAEQDKESDDETTFGIGLGQAIPVIMKQLSNLFQKGELPLDGVQFTDSGMKAFFKSAGATGSRLSRVIAIPFWVGEKHPGFGNTYEKGKIVKEGVWNIIDRKAVREYLENRKRIERDFLNDWKDAKALSEKQRNAIVEVFRVLNEQEPVKEELPDSEIQKLFALDDQTVKVYRQIRNALDAAFEARKALDRYRIKNGYFVPTPQEVKKFLKKKALLEAGIESDLVDELVAFLKKTPARSLDGEQIRALWSIPEVKEIIATEIVNRKYHKKLLANYFPMTRPADEKFAVVARKPSGTTFTFEDAEGESPEESLEDSFTPAELYFATFPTAKEANAHANELKRQGYHPPEGEENIIVYDRTKDIPERFVGRLTEDQLYDLVEDAGVKKDIPFVRTLVEELRSRGFDRHFIERQRIPGFQWNWRNIERNTTEHIDGSLRKYAKSVGLAEAEKRYREISDSLSPRNREYAREFLDAFVAANPREWEGIRQVIYIAALGFSISNGLQNLTQPLMTTLNEITIQLKEANVGFKPFLSEKIFAEALQHALAFSLVKLGRKLGKEFPVLPPEWQRLADKGRDQGVINPLQLEQMAGIVDDPRVKYLSTTRKTWRVITVITGLLQRLTEVGNRDHAFFAAMIIGSRYFKLKGDELYEFAVRFNYRTNFAFGAHNLPQAAKALRGTWWAGALRKVANLWLILRGFSLNMIGRLGAVSRSRSAGAIARTVVALLGLAGIRGLPFMAMIYTLANIVLWLMGDEETVEIKERRAFGEIEKDLGLPNRMLTTGPVGAMTGVETSRLVGLGDVLPRSVSPRDVIGVVGSYYDRIGRTLKELAEGDLGEAIEQFPLKPRVISDQMRAQKIKEEGVISSGYVNLQPEEITAADELKLRMGLTPTKVTESYEKGRAMASLGRLGREKYNGAIDDYVSAIVRGETKKQAEIIKGITEFNARVSLDNQINLKQFIQDAYLRRYDISRNKRKIPRRTQLQELYNQEDD